jgi:hypothetical protein
MDNYRGYPETLLGGEVTSKGKHPRDVEDRVEDQMCALMFGNQVGNAQLSDYLRSRKLYGMLKLVVCHPRLGSYVQDLVAEMLAGWKPRWTLPSCMSRQPGFWQAFRACNGVLLAARDFEATSLDQLGRSGHSTCFLAAAEHQDDVAWKLFGRVVRNNLGLVVKYGAAFRAVLNLLGMRAVRQAFVDCDGLVKLASWSVAWFVQHNCNCQLTICFLNTTKIITGTLVHWYTVPGSDCFQHMMPFGQTNKNQQTTKGQRC